MRQTYRVLLAALIASQARAAEPVPQVYSGHYFYNFENAALTVNGSTECWVARGDMSKAEVVPKDGKSPWGEADVVLRGALGPAGRFGNVGACTHVLSVIEIIEVRNKKGRGE